MCRQNDPVTLTLARLREEEIRRVACEHALARPKAPPGRLRRGTARALALAARRLDREAIRRASA